MTHEALTRYYYDCPLKAAFMAKYFGVEYVCEHGEEVWMCENTDFMNDCLSCKGMTSKAYIHPNSLHLLEPREGDGIQTKYGLDNIKHISDDGWVESFGGPDYAPHEFKTIQRNGQAFFWPEFAKGHGNDTDR